MRRLIIDVRLMQILFAALTIGLGWVLFFMASYCPTCAGSSLGLFGIAVLIGLPLFVMFSSYIGW